VIKRHPKLLKNEHEHNKTLIHETRLWILVLPYGAR